MSTQGNGVIPNGRGLWRGVIAGFMRLESLLQAKGSPCLVCRGKADSAAELLGLCQSCYSSLAWIKDVLCPFCGRYETCYDCSRRQQTKLRCNRSAVRYNEDMKDLLARYKYRGDEKLQRLFGSMLIYAYGQMEQSMSALNRKGRAKIITYVPLSQERFIERGFNQAEQMARQLGGALNIPVVPMLKRVRHTEKQSFKTRQDRLDDLKAVFEVDLREWNVYLQRSSFPTTAAIGPNIDIILIDDVYTTGSTLHQCASVIYQQIPAAIYGLTWAR